MTGHPYLATFWFAATVCALTIEKIGDRLGLFRSNKNAVIAMIVGGSLFGALATLAAWIGKAVAG